MDGIRYEQLGFLQINLDGKELVKDNSVAFHNKITKKMWIFLYCAKEWGCGNTEEKGLSVGVVWVQWCIGFLGLL